MTDKILSCLGVSPFASAGPSGSSETLFLAINKRVAGGKKKIKHLFGFK
jgi:hypothetical protein